VDQDQLQNWYQRNGLGGLIDDFAAHGMPLPEPDAAMLQSPPPKIQRDLTTLEGWHPQSKPIKGFLASVPKEQEFSFVPRRRVTKMMPTPENDAASYWNEWGARCIDPSSD
jgi:hypothetical protein